jgi:hypothetical protein
MLMRYGNRFFFGWAVQQDLRYREKCRMSGGEVCMFPFSKTLEMSKVVTTTEE